MRACHVCGKGVEGSGRIGREDVCSHCRADLHCCLNCRFFDEYAQNKCRESSAEWVSDREKNNFCDYFSFRDSAEAGRREKERQDARAKLEALFKRK
jgi:hypothetical protein